MRILLTNDDGIHAEGLACLERIARTFSDDVWVVAPEMDQSGFAHSLSISEPLRIHTSHLAVKTGDAFEFSLTRASSNAEWPVASDRKSVV